MSGVWLGLVVDGPTNRIELQQCSLYAHKHPLAEQHHVCPESWWVAAGKPVQSPLRLLCPDCHYGCHVAIDGLLQNRDLSLLKSRWVALARQAFVIAEANGLTPARTL